MFQIRIIPATISTAMLLLCVKIADITHSSEALAEAAPAASAPASSEKAAAKPAEKTAEKPAEAKKDAAADKKDGKGDAKPEEKTEGKKEGGGEGKDDKKVNPAVSSDPGDIVEHRFTPIELDMLQNLVKRREELDRWEKNIEVKENVLNATEKRVDEKINQIEAMKKEVTLLLAQYNEKEDAKIQSLVKIYQDMKPKDAARIFDELDVPILLLVVDKMPEKNTAPILALMDPKKAKQITVQLAEQRKLITPKTGDAPAVPEGK